VRADLKAELRRFAYLLTGGEASDSPQFAALLDIGPDVYPRAAFAGEGYDSQANRHVARAHGVWRAIPYRSNVKNQPKVFAKILCAGRARIEITVGKIRSFKRIGLRCEKTATNFASQLAFVPAIILVKYIHTA
jgi:hypothetical protein